MTVSPPRPPERLEAVVADGGGDLVQPLAGGDAGGDDLRTLRVAQAVPHAVARHNDRRAPRQAPAVRHRRRRPHRKPRALGMM